MNFIRFKKQGKTIFKLLDRHTVIADHRISRDQYLPLIRRIRQTLRITRHCRIKNNLTQEELAEKVGTGLRHLLGIENEGKSPGFNLLCNLIWELNISADSIFYPEKTSENAQIEEISRLLHRCDDRSLQVIRTTLQALLDGQPKR